MRVSETCSARADSDKGGIHTSAEYRSTLGESEFIRGLFRELAGNGIAVDNIGQMVHINAEQLANFGAEAFMTVSDIIKQGSER